MIVDTKDSINFLKAGYKDYLSARLNLNNELVYTGAILASNAVEKHLKALMSISGNIERLHMDKIKKIEQILKGIDIDIIDKLDIDFLYLLGKIYKFRYYDNFKKGIHGFGFSITQFLGELDNTIFTIDKTIIIENNGVRVKSPYKLGVESKNILLTKNNFILNKINKKEFMEQESKYFSLVLSDKQEIIDTVFGPLKSEYNGHINILSDFRTKP